MYAAIAVPGNSRTILTHLFGRGLEDDRYRVERFQSMADGKIGLPIRAIRELRDSRPTPARTDDEREREDSRRGNGKGSRETGLFANPTSATRTHGRHGHGIRTQPRGDHRPPRRRRHRQPPRQQQARCQPLCQ